MSPMCVSSSRVQHLSTNPLNSFKISGPSKKHAEEKELLHILLFFWSFMHHLLFWRCLNGAFGAAFRQGLDDLAKTALKTAMWPCFQHLQRISHVSSRNCWGPAALHALHWASTKPTDLNCTLGRTTRLDKCLNRMLKDAQMAPQSSGCRLHFLWLWVIGNWQVRADARRTWKTKTDIESLILRLWVVYHVISRQCCQKIEDIEVITCLINHLVASVDPSTSSSVHSTEANSAASSVYHSFHS